MDFSWDETKNRRNFKKHGIWFDESLTVFRDKNAIEIYDIDNSAKDEDRYILIGMSTGLRILVVIYVENIEGQVRIISSRRACRSEVLDYEKKI